MGGNRNAGRGGRRLFTVAEANALLPEVIPILESLRDDKAHVEAARDALAEFAPAMRADVRAWLAARA